VPKRCGHIRCGRYRRGEYIRQKWDVSGKGAGESGGTIALSADRANIADGARLDASGDSGGGAILIGSNPSSGASNQNVHTVTIGQAELAAMPDATVTAEPLRYMRLAKPCFAGSIEAKGGLNGGHGGAVESRAAIWSSRKALVSIRPPLPVWVGLGCSTDELRY
jgi:hypothetical protein